MNFLDDLVYAILVAVIDIGEQLGQELLLRGFIRLGDGVDQGVGVYRILICDAVRFVYKIGKWLVNERFVGVAVLQFAHKHLVLIFREPLL